mgnify:CR=1 FL=1
MKNINKDLLLKFERFETKLADHDDKIMLILEYIRQFEKAKQQELEQMNRQRYAGPVGWIDANNDG